jgi:hypothetical protein
LRGPRRVLAERASEGRTNRRSLVLRARLPYHAFHVQPTRPDDAYDVLLNFSPPLLSSTRRRRQVDACAEAVEEERAWQAAAAGRLAAELEAAHGEADALRSELRAAEGMLEDKVRALRPRGQC